jgi:hypothetical protein
MNPSRSGPGVTKLDDGRMLLETWDCGRSIRMIEPDGKVSMVITGDLKPTKSPAPPSDKPFHVRHTSSGQEIASANGEVIATTTDEKHATHICHLLIVWENMKAKKAASGS